MARSWNLTLAFVVLACPAPTFAHELGLSRGDYRVEGREVSTELVFARTETSSVVTAAEIVERVAVRTPAGPCPGELLSAAPVDQDGLAIRAVYRCAEAPSSVVVRLSFFPLLSHGHRHLATVVAGSNLKYFVAYERLPELEIDVPQASTTRLKSSIVSVAGALFSLGVEHILTGYDHLLFLLGLILVGGRLRSLFLVVTAFTVAHSMTLALAVLDVWAPSPRFVEPAIALSIAYVGVENWFVEDVKHRWRITFPFGLIHGFGFAGALREIDLPSDQIPVALAAFNLGVEAGQLAALVVAVPILLWLVKRAWFGRRGARAVSAAIVTFGLYWFIERVLSL